ncbi:MAG: YtxH domain-containing protein [Clostridia bacterium]|nr:YtxH domain-containing protein [Clostridia bacterium]
MKIADLLAKSKKDQKKKAAKNLAIGTGIGAAVGAALGLLFAPKAGKETREDIANAGKQAVENVKESIDTIKEKVEEYKASKEKCCCEDKCEEAESEDKA